MRGADTLAIGYVHPHEVSALFMQSVVNLMVADHGRGSKRRLEATIAVGSGPRIASARNDVVRTFLRSSAEWLLMIDTDMVFAPSAVDRLLEVADPTHRPIVGGLCFGGGRGGRLFPTLYRLRPTSDGHPEPVEVVEDYPEDTLVRVDATGAAFLLMHRATLKRIGRTYGGDRMDGPAPWFIEGSVYKGLSFGEDWAFCMRAKELGIAVHVHTGVEIGHVKPVVLGSEQFAAFRAKRDAIGLEGILAEHRELLTGAPDREREAV